MVMLFGDQPQVDAMLQQRLAGGDDEVEPFRRIQRLRNLFVVAAGKA
ncbi:MAG: hypothetical protein ACK4OP_15770 [Gemmobacter sp.]